MRSASVFEVIPLGYDWTAPSAVVEGVESLLEAGEAVVAAAPFEEWTYRWNADQGDYERVLVRGRPGFVARLLHGDGWNLLVLTNRYLRELYIVMPRGRAGEARTTVSSALPLAQIAAVEVTDHARGVAIQFSGPDGDHWYTSTYAPAQTLAAELQRLALAAATSATSGDQLTRLAELRTAGMISADEWEQAKALYLGRPPSDQEQAARELRQLYALHRSGVLSQSEFNMKKWDVLARRARRT